MKMKDVIAITSLTDRAVRLYIENGLVAPTDNKTHTGRSNLNFSESDVELLNKIAVLRKAGFSIAQIKSIETDSTQAQEAVNELLAEKKAEQELNDKVIEALSPLRENDKLNIDVISECLESSIGEEMAQREEMIMIANDRSEKRALRAFAYIIFGIIGIFIYLYCEDIFSEVAFTEYFYLDTMVSHFSLMLIYSMCPIICGIAILVLYKIKFVKDRDKKIRLTASCALSITGICLSVLFMCVVAFSS